MQIVKFRNPRTEPRTCSSLPIDGLGRPVGRSGPLEVSPHAVGRFYQGSPERRDPPQALMTSSIHRPANGTWTSEESDQPVEPDTPAWPYWPPAAFSSMRVAGCGVIPPPVGSQITPRSSTVR